MAGAARHRLRDAALAAYASVHFPDDKAGWARRARAPALSLLRDECFDLVFSTAPPMSAVVGVWRGLVFELMSLFGWVVAYVAAQAFSPQVGAYIPLGTPGSAMHQAFAFFATFVGSLLVWALLARLVRMAIQATPLTVPDRLLGGGFGLLRGLVVLLAVAHAGGA